MTTRAEILVNAFRTYPGRNLDGVVWVGGMCVRSVELDGPNTVSVMVDGVDDPHFRITNPPLRTSAGIEDPVRALAAVIRRYTG